MLIFNLVLGMLILLGVFAFVLTKILFSATDRDIHRLNREAELAQKKQEELQEKTKECETACKNKIAEATQEAEKIKQTMILEATEKGKEIVALARKQGEEILQSAADSKEKMKQNIINEMDLKTVDFATIVLGKILDESASKTLNEHLAEQFVKELPSVDNKFLDNIKDVEILTRYELPGELKNRIKEIVCKKINRQIELKEKVDSSLVSGVILKFGTLVLDGSLKAKIREVSEAIKKSKEE
jgi:F0F1-type ATP synthase delta subunit